MRPELKVLTALVLLGVFYLVMCVVGTVRHGETPWCPQCGKLFTGMGHNTNLAECTYSCSGPHSSGHEWHRPKYMIRLWLIDDD